MEHDIPDFNILRVGAIIVHVEFPTVQQSYSKAQVLTAEPVLNIHPHCILYHSVIPGGGAREGPGSAAYN